MQKMALINMPFASLHLPSIGLTHLQAILEERFGDRLEVEIHYLNQDFGRQLGAELYTWMALSGEAHNSGFGDWFFRQAAFPELPDNADAYFRRFFPNLDQRSRAMKQIIQENLKKLDETLDSLIAKYPARRSADCRFHIDVFTKHGQLCHGQKTESD